MLDMILLNADISSSCYSVFDNLWEKAYYWRYITIISIFLMIVYKRKVAFYEKLTKQLENDKKIIRRALFIYSEIHLKELMKYFINFSGYTTEQINKLKEFEQYLNESENKLMSENLQEATRELKSALNESIDNLEKCFVKEEEKDSFVLKTDANMDSAEAFEFQDKISSKLTTFESKYFNFIHEVKKEFI